MKRISVLTTGLIFIVVLAFAPPKHTITGRWLVHYSNGYEAWVDFKADGTFRNYDDKGKTLHQGNYKFNDKDVFSTTDKEGCGESYWATYKISFINNDSATVTVISDSCTGRVQAINNSTVKRKRQIHT